MNASTRRACASARARQVGSSSTCRSTPPSVGAVDRVGPVRICRFTTGEDPLYGVLTGDLDDYGQPDDAVIVALAGDPLYVGVKPLGEQEHRLEDVRLLAPVLPRSKVVGIGRNYAAHAAEMGNEVPTEPLMFIKQHQRDRPRRLDRLPEADREPALRG